jgi:hypothetical protein
MMLIYFEDCSIGRFRLTYDYIKHLLVIDMPTVLHEAFYDDLKKSFTFAMDYIPYHHRTINPQVHMNYPLQITDKSVTPDMAILLTTRQGPTEILIIPFIGETAGGDLCINHPRT